MQTNIIHTGDSLKWLKTLPDKCCDVFTDPPYNVGKDYGPMPDKLSDRTYRLRMRKVLRELKRVGNNITIYVPKKYNLFYWNELGDDFQEIILPFRPAGALRYGYSNQFNKLLTNARPKLDKPVLNVWDNMPQPGMGFFFREETYDHPGYTSEAITVRAIAQLTTHEVICDPYMGTRTTAVAAIKCGRQYIGCEGNPDKAGVYHQRIDNASSVLQLFKSA